MVVGLLAAACSDGAGNGQAAAKLALTSPAFAPGGRIPEKHACTGDNVSPPLSWSGVPSGTEELALTLEDPEGPRGTFVHWVLWGVEPRRAGLEEGTIPPGAREGLTDAGGQ